MPFQMGRIHGITMLLHISTIWSHTESISLRSLTYVYDILTEGAKFIFIALMAVVFISDNTLCSAALRTKNCQRCFIETI